MISYCNKNKQLGSIITKCFQNEFSFDIVKYKTSRTCTASWKLRSFYNRWYIV